MMQPFRNSRRRPAFTLVEILTVIAIMAILAALSAWGVFAMIGVQQRRNSQNAIRVVDKLLHDRWDAVVADAKKEKPSAAALSLAGGDNARAQVIWIKVRLVEAFPVTYAEVIPTVATPASIVNYYIPAAQRKPHFTKYQTILTGKTGGGAGESSACLLMALKTLASDGVSVEDQLKTFVKDTDNDGMPELIDGWTKPLAFGRFVTQPPNPSASAGTRSAKFADPLDPEGTLLSPIWYANGSPTFPLRTQFETGNIAVVGLHSIGPAPVAPSNVPANAFYVLPVVASGGPDGNMASVADNIFNFKLRGE